MCFKKASLMAIFFSLAVYQADSSLKPNIVGKYYFDRKIKSYKKKNLTIDERRELIKLEVQYAYGIILEKSDRIIDENYQEAINLNRKAHPHFKNAIELSISNLKKRYPSIENWLVGDDVEISFKNEDLFDLYWLAAGYGGSIKSSRGNPYELLNINKIGRILYAALNVYADWNYGVIYSAMMSYMISRPDLSGEALQDSIDKYYSLSISATDSLMPLYL